MGIVPSSPVDPGLVQPEPFRPGGAPDRPQQAFATADPAVVALDGERAPIFPAHPAHLAAGDHLDAVGTHLLPERTAQHVVEVPQDAIAPYQQGHPRAERLEHAAQFDRDVAAAHHHDPGRRVVEAKEAVRGDAELRPRRLRHRRVAAGRDDHVAGAMARPRDFHLPRAGEAGGAPEAVDAAVLEALLVDAVQAPHVGVAGLLEIRPAEPRLTGRKAVAASLLQGVGDARPVPHHLLRHAAHVHAGASQGAVLDHRAAHAVGGGAHRAGDTAAAATDHQTIVGGRHRRFGPCREGSGL